MNNYEDEYLKYKTKYLKLKDFDEQTSGAIKIKETKQDFENKITQIINFIIKSKKEKIKNELYNIINYKEICPIVLGEGFSGRAYIPEVNKTIPYQFDNQQIELPIVIKETKNFDNPDIYFGLDIFDSKLYISGYADMTTEAIILMFIKQLWNKTVHLPLILGYSTCSKNKLIDRIITMRYGLDKLIQIDLTGKIFNENQMWHKPKKEPVEIFSSTIATLGELFIYIHYSKKSDGSVILPNGIKCDNVSELFDYMCISYLVTHELLVKNRIYPSDMHKKNIFIHWFNHNSYYNGSNIKNIQEIVYKVSGKYYKIKTFGFVIILGDTGTFMIDVKKDVVIVGQVWDIKKNYKLIKRRMRTEFTNSDFILWNCGFLTTKEFNKTIGFQILNSEPYCSYPTKTWRLLGWDISYLDKLKSTEELLEFYYKKYGIKKYEEDKNNILIQI